MLGPEPLREWYVETYERFDLKPLSSLGPHSPEECQALLLKLMGKGPGTSISITLDPLGKPFFMYANRIAPPCITHEASALGEMDSSAKCKDCGQDLGWWCPNGPDHVCHYSEGNYDSCDYCGDPEERQ